MRRKAAGIGAAMAFGLALWSCGGVPAFAQSGPEATPASDSLTQAQRNYMASLDRDLAAQDYDKLATSILKPGPSAYLKPALDWTRDGTLKGRSIIVPLIYSSLLWNLGVSFPQLPDFKTSSGIIALYALLVAHADGPKCADPTAPAHRIDVITRDDRKQFETIAALPAKKRHDALAAAIRLERSTAKLRTDDKYLCRFGMQETLAILRQHQGEKLKEKKPESAFTGIKIEKKAESAFAGLEIQLPADAPYMPSFLPYDQWASKQAAIRATFPAMLTAFIAKFKPQAAQHAH